MTPSPDHPPDHPTRPLPRPAAFVWRFREGASTLLMGLAAVLTAWCAFEATKWSGIEAIRFALAGAARTESTRSSLTDMQLTQIDVDSFLAWVQALAMERGDDLSRPGKTAYQPDLTKVSGFLYERFRPAFREAVQAWVAMRPLLNPDAPQTPFAMEAYRRPLAERAAVLDREADGYTSKAREANRIGDNYTLITVFSSLVIFFAGMSAKLETPPRGVLMFVLAALAFVLCVVTISRFPVVIVS